MAHSSSITVNQHPDFAWSPHFYMGPQGCDDEPCRHLPDRRRIGPTSRRKKFNLLVDECVRCGRILRSVGELTWREYFWVRRWNKRVGAVSLLLLLLCAVAQAQTPTAAPFSLHWSSSGPYSDVQPYVLKGSPTPLAVIHSTAFTPIPSASPNEQRALTQPDALRPGDVYGLAGSVAGAWSDLSNTRVVPTYTVTATATATASPSPTFSATHTYTITPTHTYTATPTLTPVTPPVLLP